MESTSRQEGEVAVSLRRLPFTVRRSPILGASAMPIASAVFEDVSSTKKI
jgi:hypothetical protein